MKLSMILVLIALTFFSSVFRGASASVLTKLEDGYKLLAKNRRVFKPSGDHSPGSRKVIRVWPATIQCSSHGVATLYINGIIYSKLFSPHPWSMTVGLAKGDVIAIKAEKTDNDVGVMVTIAWKGRTYRSGRHIFKVRSDSYFNWNAIEQDTWNRAVRGRNGKPKLITSFCSWKKADIVEFKKDKFDKKAFFIWSLHSSRNHGVHAKTPAQTVYIRHVMGGDKCPKDSKKGAKTKKRNSNDGAGKKKRNEKNSIDTSTNEDKRESQKQKNSSQNEVQGGMDIGIGGQSDTRTCKCRLVSMHGGTCFDMVTPGDDEGPCSARTCEPQYECAHDGKTMCFMRRMLTRVVMTGPRSCKKISAATDLLVPYKR